MPEQQLMEANFYLFCQRLIAETLSFKVLCHRLELKKKKKHTTTSAIFPLNAVILETVLP